MRPKKASIHVSVDEKLKQRLQLIAMRLSVPMSHLVSLSLGRVALQYERDFLESTGESESTTNRCDLILDEHHSEASLDTG